MSKAIIFTILVLGLLQLVSAKRSNVRRGCIRVYEHVNFKGQSHLFCGTTSYSKFFRGWNDKASSYCVGSGSNFKLWQHSIGKGAHVYARAGTCKNVPRSFNDHLSSLQKVSTKRCRNVRRNQCRNVRRYRKKRVRKPYYTTEKAIRTIRKRRAHRVCSNKKYKIYYRKPVRTTKRVRYTTKQAYWHYYNTWQTYYRNVRKTKRVGYWKSYRVNVRKPFKIRYKKWYVKRVKQNYKSICSKRVRVPKTRRVKKRYKSTCPRTRLAYKWKYYTGYVWQQKRYTVETNQFVPSGKKNCYKKKRVVRYKKVRVPKRKKRIVRYSQKYRASCIKTKKITQRYSVTVLKRYSCTKQRTVLRKYSKIHTKTVHRNIPTVKRKRVYKKVSYNTRVKSRRRVRKKTRRVRNVYKYKNVTTYVSRRAWRWGSKVVYRTVYRNENVKQIYNKRVRKYRWKIINQGYNTRLCKIVTKRVCN